MCSDRQQRTARIKIARLDRRLAVLVDDPTLRNLLAFVDGDHQLAFGDGRRRDIENGGIPAGNRHADREWIGRQPPITAAKRRDALRARRVQKMQRDLTGIGRHLEFRGLLGKA